MDDGVVNHSYVVQQFSSNFGRPPRTKPCLHPFATQWEKDMDDFVFDQNIWVYYNWTLVFAVVVLYLALIFAGQRWMRDRPPFELRTPLIWWNWMLAVFSVIILFKGSAFLVGEYSLGTLHEHFCYTFTYRKPQYPGCSGYPIWAWLFAASKFVELGDTFFIVLRKRPLIFLHWWHHCTVLVGSVYFVAYGISLGAYVIVVNGTIHAFMYTYYALRAMDIKMPKRVSMMLTSMQILQMLGPITGAFYMAKLMKTVPGCILRQRDFNNGLFLVISYLLLFMNYFHKAYISDNKKKAKAAEEEKQLKRKQEAASLQGTLFNFVDTFNECNFAETKKRKS